MNDSNWYTIHVNIGVPVTLTNTLLVMRNIEFLCWNRNFVVSSPFHGMLWLAASSCLFHFLIQITRGFNRLYLARNRETGERVVIKRIRWDSDDNTGVTPDAIRKLSILQDINHPNVVK